MKLLSKMGVRNKHFYIFFLILAIWWGIYWEFLIAKFHYTVDFLVIFLMGFLTYWLMTLIFKESSMKSLVSKAKKFMFFHNKGAREKGFSAN